MKIPTHQYQCPLGRVQPQVTDLDSIKEQGWRDQHILVVNAEDARLDFCERQLVRRIGGRHCIECEWRLFVSDTTNDGSKLDWTSTDAMRPTQCSVGYVEVELKMQELRERTQKSGLLEKYLKTHPIPAVLGPDGRMYLTDHHHMGLAMVRLADEWDATDKPAAKNPFRICCFQIVKDLSDQLDLTMRKFFAKMEEHHLSHPFDGQGKRVEKIPKYLSELVDDPYRSLAGLARKAGAYDKVAVPFTEFKWADYLRDKVEVKLICMEHLAQAIQQAVVLANEPAACSLPGFHGAKPAAELPALPEIQDRLSKRHGADDAAPDLPAVSIKKHSSR